MSISRNYLKPGEDKRPDTLHCAKIFANKDCRTQPRAVKTPWGVPTTLYSRLDAKVYEATNAKTLGFGVLARCHNIDFDKILSVFLSSAVVVAVENAQLF
jgi:hypothetical protein